LPFVSLGEVMESRLTELESRVAFQEHSIQELNDVIIEQQKTIERLLLEVQSLKNHVKTLSPSIIATQAEETPPPHY